MSSTEETKHDEWDMMLKKYGFLQPLAIGEQSIQQCQFSITDKQSHCPCFDRIKYILKYYDEWSNKTLNNDENKMNKYISIHQYLNKDLKCYNTTSLINDYNHILRFHQPNDAEFEFMTNKLTKCDITKCNKIRRNEQKNRDRNNKESDYNLYFGICDKVEISCIDSLDRIHCTLCHSYDLFRLTISEKETLAKSQRILSPTTIDMIQKINSKSFNNLKIIRESKGNGKEDDYSKFIDVVNEEKEDRETLVDEDMSVMSIYDFGYEYDYNEIQPRYKNLREELLNNEICQIDLDEWNITTEKAWTIMKCQNARQTFLHSHFENLRCSMWYIEDGECERPDLSKALWNRIKAARNYDSYSFLENMIAILFYCNYTNLQHHLSQTYRLIDNNDSIEKMKKRHQQYVNWAMLIYTTLSAFGSSMKQTEEFYRGITGNVLVPRTNACFYAPTSTSSNILVAQNFAGNEGIVLCLNNGIMEKSINENIPKYLDCSWISDYHYECENLFAGTMKASKHVEIVGNILSISSIIDCKNGICKKMRMQLPLTFFKSVTETHSESKTLFEESRNITQSEYIEQIEAIMTDKIFSKYKKHSFQLIEIRNICKAVKKLYLSGAIAKYYPKKFLKNNYRTVNFSIILKLFLNATHSFIYDFVLDDVMYESVLRALNTTKYTNINHIEFIGSFKIIKHWKDTFGTIGWLILSFSEYMSLQRNDEISLNNDERIIMLNTTTSLISVEKYLIQVSIPQIYAINIKIDDVLLIIRKRYSQFRGLRNKLVKAKIIDQETIFPEKQLLFVDVEMRAILLGAFLQHAVDKCREKNQFNIIYEFLFIQENMKRPNMLSNSKWHYTYNPMGLIQNM